MKVQSSSPPYDGTAEEKYRYAQYLRYDEKCPQDAILWYNLAEQLGHTEAAYQLAQYYLKKGEDQDVELGNYYLLKAKLGFEDTLLDSVNAMQLQAISDGNTYADAIADFGPLEAEEKKQQRAISRAAYFLGRIYTTGIEIANIDGIESEDLPALQVATDPHKAAAYFEFAYRSGYKHAAYYLGNLYFHGKLSPADKPDYERAAGWYMANTENPYCQFALAKMIEHGQGFTPNVETAETLYRKCLNANDYLTAESSYAIAQMQNNEQLPLTDMQKLYKTAAEIWLKDDHPENHIHLRLARMYEYGLGVPEDLSLAIDHYTAALKTPETEYKLGQLMQRIDGDATEIYAHYAAARVGMLYLIYQDKQGNIVFVCYDCFGRVKSAHKRGTNSAQRYRSFVTGGEFNCGFSYANDNATVLYVFEAPIDLMSFLTLHRHKPWHRASYLSLGGLSEDPLRRFLKEHKSIQRIAFCFDNDINKPENKGQEAAKRFMRQFSGKYITSILCPCKKDWNDVLRDKIQKGEFL